MKTESNKAVLLIAIAVALAVLALSTLVTLRVQAQIVTFNKSNFHDPLKIDNKYFPLKPGKYNDLQRYRRGRRAY